MDESESNQNESEEVNDNNDEDDEEVLVQDEDDEVNEEEEAKAEAQKTKDAQKIEEEIKEKQKEQQLKEEKERESLIEASTEEMKEVINAISLNIFLNFSKFYYEEKDFLLSYQALTKLMRNAGIIGSKGSSKIKQSQFDVLFKQISPKKTSKLTSNQFLNLIVILASKDTPEKFKSNPKSAVYQFVKSRLEPISAYINDSETTASSQFLFKSIESKAGLLPLNSIDDKVKLIITSLSKSIRTIYSLYFPFELTKQHSNALEQLVKASLSALIDFCKNYEIIPSLLSIEKVGILYKCLMDKEEVLLLNAQNCSGNVFTLNKFCAFFIYAAYLAFELTDEPLAEKVVMLFKRLETSSGCVLTEKKHHRSSVEVLSLSLDKDIVKQIVPVCFSGSKKETEDEVQTAEPTNVVKTTETRGFNYRNTQEEDIESESKENEILEDLYETYSTLGDKLNLYQMTITSFHKFLKDIGVFEIKRTMPTNSNTNTFRFTQTSFTEDHLTEKETNLIFFEVCGMKRSVIDSNELLSSFIGKKEGKAFLRMSFESFLSALQVIALRLHPNSTPQEAFALLKSQDLALDNMTDSNEKGAKQCLTSIIKINNSDLKPILFHFQTSMYSCYLNYADAKERISFQQFFRFYKDFSIFPDIAGLVEVKKLFYVLLQVQAEQIQMNKTIDKCVHEEESGEKRSTMTRLNAKFDSMMNFDIFFYSLALISGCVKAKDNMSEYEQLLFLFSKMAMSQGVNTPRQIIGKGKLVSVKKEIVEAIEAVKEKYPSYFPQKDQMKEIMKSENVFNDLFTD